MGRKGLLLLKTCSFSVCLPMCSLVHIRTFGFTIVPFSERLNSAFISLKSLLEQNVVFHTYNPSTQDAEAGGLRI